VTRLFIVNQGLVKMTARCADEKFRLFQYAGAIAQI
jgi:hypothetical protein